MRTLPLREHPGACSRPVRPFSRSPFGAGAICPGSIPAAQTGRKATARTGTGILGPHAVRSPSFPSDYPHIRRVQTWTAIVKPNVCSGASVGFHIPERTLRKLYECDGGSKSYAEKSGDSDGADVSFPLPDAAGSSRDPEGYMDGEGKNVRCREKKQFTTCHQEELEIIV